MIQVDMHREFSDTLKKLSDFFRLWGNNVRDDTEKAIKTICIRFRAEARQRCPVDFGTLRQKILWEVFNEGKDIVGAVGSNLEYAKFVEFGTKYIAHGLVLALGTSPDVTDAQAIKAWPAKNFGSGEFLYKKVKVRTLDGKHKVTVDQNTGWRKRGGFINELTGEARDTVVNHSLKVHSLGLAQEQMPFLRPAFNAIKEWGVALLSEALKPPGGGKQVA